MELKLLVEKDDIWFPDFFGHDANDVDSCEFARIPL